MADLTFNTAAGQTVNREMLVAYLNTGTNSTPVWSPVGKRVEDSSAEYDWGDENKRDILGDTYASLKTPIITQTFEPCELDGGDVAQVKLWNMAIKDHDIAALSAQDMLIVHLYAGTADTAMFAERYESCMIKVTSIGGEGGGALGMPIEVTYGGARSIGTAALSTAGVITFTAS